MKDDLIADLITESTFVKHVAIFSLLVSFLCFGSVVWLFHMVQK